MDRLITTLVFTFFIVGYLICFCVAVDVATRHPFDWKAAGSSQKFRIFLIFAPLISIGFSPLGAVTGMVYLGKVRPSLTLNARRAIDQGWPPPPRKPTLGLNWVWQELRTAQKVKSLLAVTGAAFLDLAIAKSPPPQEGLPRWFGEALIFSLWPSFFCAIYLGLTVAQIYLTSSSTNRRKSSAMLRTEGLAMGEYYRRVERFQARNVPRQPWNRQ
ncbi:hypothetical protein [Streptomyces sp. NPDC048643]|uniref:hypothetical protein n=1 Tax=Streptomyces sp. NPDC048643 TaxID=3155637 RepID=UPI00343656F8